jgi:hypothetical protein
MERASIENSKSLKFNAMPLDASLPFDFVLRWVGGLTGHPGYSFMGQLEVIQTGGTVNKPEQTRITIEPPSELDVKVPVLPPGYSSPAPRTLTGIWIREGNGALELRQRVFVAGQAIPGTYPVRFTVTVRGIEKTLTVPFRIEAIASLPPRSIASIPAIPELARWEKIMVDTGKFHCDWNKIKDLSTSELGVWYYDGLRIYYQIADYTKDPFWNTCAGYVKSIYRDAYVLPNTGKIPGYRVFGTGLRMDFERTRQTQSAVAIDYMTENAAFGASAGSLDPITMRETAYSLLAHLSRHRLGRGGDFRKAADHALTQFDQLFVSKTFKGHHTFTVGLMMEALIDYYAETADPRVPPAIQKAADWLVDEAWNPADQGFIYHRLLVQGKLNPIRGEPELNQLIAPGLAWMWAMTGNTKYLQVGDAAYAAAVRDLWLGSGKIFSQKYRWSFDFVKWRTHPDTALARFQRPSLAVAKLSPRAFPNPWRKDRHGAARPYVRFDHLTTNCVVRIFTTSGHLVRTLNASGDGIDWDLTNESGKKVASGIYIYMIKDEAGQIARGKLAVVR